MTDYVTQHNAIRTRFTQQWGTETAVQWPNVKFIPPNNTSWVRFQISDSGAFNASMGDPGNNLKRYTGLVTVQIFTLLGKGDSESLRLADLATAIYRGWEDDTSRVFFREPPFARQVPGRADTDKWHQVNVVAPFERDSYQ